MSRARTPRRRFHRDRREHPGAPDLSTPGAVVVVGMVGFLVPVGGVLTADRLVQLDHGVSAFVQALRTPATDQLIVALTSLGDGAVLTPVCLALVGWLVLGRRARLALGVAVATSLGAAGGAMLKAFLQIPRPTPMYSGFDAYAFPSGHTLMSTVILGFAAWIIAGSGTVRLRAIAYSAYLVWVIAIGFSRVYLGAHWPSDVLAGLSLGLALVAATAIFYRNHIPVTVPVRRLPVLLLVVFAGAGIRHLARDFDSMMARYAAHPVAVAMSPER